jgi:hypothetical protein
MKKTNQSKTMWTRDAERNAGQQAILPHTHVCMHCGHASECLFTSDDCEDLRTLACIACADKIDPGKP